MEPTDRRIIETERDHGGAVLATAALLVWALLAALSICGESGTALATDERPELRAATLR